MGSPGDPRYLVVLRCSPGKANFQCPFSFFSQIGPAVLVRGTTLGRKREDIKLYVGTLNWNESQIFTSITRKNHLNHPATTIYCNLVLPISLLLALWPSPSMHQESGKTPHNSKRDAKVGHIVFRHYILRLSLLCAQISEKFTAQ